MIVGRSEFFQDGPVCYDAGWQGKSALSRGFTAPGNVQSLPEASPLTMLSDVFDAGGDSIWMLSRLPFRIAQSRVKKMPGEIDSPGFLF